MKTLFDTAHIYMIIGLIAGFYYREITKIEHFTGPSQLAVAHTHVPALGMLFFLIVLALEKQFTLSARKSLYGCIDDSRTPRTAAVFAEQEAL